MAKLIAGVVAIILIDLRWLPALLLWFLIFKEFIMVQGLLMALVLQVTLAFGPQLPKMSIMAINWFDQLAFVLELEELVEQFTDSFG